MHTDKTEIGSSLRGLNPYFFSRPFAESATVLDYQCGYGFGAALLSERAREITAVCSSTQALAYCKHVHGGLENVSFLHAGQDLPSPSKQFQLITCFGVLAQYSSERIEEVIRDLHGLLSNDGILIISLSTASSAPGSANDLPRMTPVSPQAYQDIETSLTRHFTDVKCYDVEQNARFRTLDSDKSGGKRTDAPTYVTSDTLLIASHASFKWPVEQTPVPGKSDLLPTEAAKHQVKDRGAVHTAVDVRILIEHNRRLVEKIQRLEQHVPQVEAEPGFPTFDQLLRKAYMRLKRTLSPHLGPVGRARLVRIRDPLKHLYYKLKGR